MSVIRVNKTKNYTVMSNYHLRDKGLSLKAIGLLSKILSLPDNWDYSISGLVAICKEQRSAVESALKELRENGYVTVDKLMPNQTESGRIEYVYNIYENPCQVRQGNGKQDIENLYLESQVVENNEQLNKDEQNKDESSKDIKHIVNYLNEKAGTHYRATTDTTIKVINARLNEKFTVDDFKTVIDKKVEQWKGTQMEEYLRPQTLFGTKFESYLNQTINKPEKPVKTANTPPEPPRYKQFTPDEEVDAVPMPDEVRKKMFKYEKALGL